MSEINLTSNRLEIKIEATKFNDPFGCVWIEYVEISFIKQPLKPEYFFI